MALDNSQKRKLSIFFKCFLISLLGWLLFALSNKYTYTKKAPLVYINEPRAKALRALQSDTVVVRLETTGWQLFFSSILREEIPLQVDLSGLASRQWVLFSNQIGLVNRQFPNNQRVISVSPDTLFFDFTRQSEKRVPIKVVHAVQFANQYGIVGDISTKPEFVTLLGPQEEVSGIKAWETDTLKVDQAKGSVNRLIALKSPNSGNVKVYPHQVEVQIPIGEMTEKILEVPLTALHKSSFRSVRLLPGKVRVTVMVSLDDFPKIDTRDFEVTVDLNEWVDWKVSSLPVVVSKIPDYCKLVSVYPQNIDFFVAR